MKYHIDIAMRNSYDIIINNVSLRHFDDVNNSYFIHNPTHDVTDDVLDDMYRYFKSTGEWDKVIKIATLRAKIKFYDTTKRLSKVYSRKSD